MSIYLAKASKSDYDSILNLLINNDLPIADLSPDKAQFFVAKDFDSNKIVGCIGLETYENHALLRSFAVDKSYQKQKIGAQLLDFFLSESKKQEFIQIHLLTTTAESYFSGKGFRKYDRKNAPEILQQSTEFAGLCPASSAYMLLSLNSSY